MVTLRTVNLRMPSERLIPLTSNKRYLLLVADPHAVFTYREDSTERSIQLLVMFDEAPLPPLKTMSTKAIHEHTYSATNRNEGTYRP